MDRLLRTHRAGRGFDSGGTQTAAVDRGPLDRQRTKTFITNATHASSYVCAVRTDTGAGRGRGISAMAVERGFPGFSPGKKESKLGMRSSDTAQIHFTDCKVPKDALLGELHNGFLCFMKTLDGGRISIGALALGIAQGAHDRSVAYARTRKQFGKAIGGFQAVGNTVADQATEIEAARHLVYAARAKDAHRPFSRNRPWPSSSPPGAMRACARPSRSMAETATW